MNRAVPDDVVDEIRRRCDIVDVVGAVVQLKRAGGGAYKGLCPFHQEKTPSFTVNQARGHYHCFGCGKGGDVFRFVMEREGVDFPNALHLLAARCGVVIPERAASTGDARERKTRADERERLYRINEEFARFFERRLREHPESPAAQYLARRGVPEDVAQKFRLGAAPDEWDACVRYGRSLGFRDTELLLAGIIRRHEESGRLYDHFRGRLTFAIWNETGKVVGFSARTLEADAPAAKYVNTSETPVFRKSDLLYALPLARVAAREQKKMILAEGQLDTIAFHRAGFACAVAPQGTAFTEAQARIVARYTECVLLAFDADGAGQKAIRRALELLLPLDLEIKVIRIPGGKDPDELFRTGGTVAVEQAVFAAEDWIDWRCAALETEFDLASPAGNARAVDEIILLLALVQHPVQLELSIRRVAEKLHVSAQSLHAALTRALRARKRRENGAGTPASHAEESKADVPRSNRHRAELALLELALADANAAREAADRLPPGELSPERSGKSLNLLLALALNGESEHAHSLLEEQLRAEPDAELSKALLAAQTYSPEETERILADCIGVIHQEFILGERLRLQAEIQREPDQLKQIELLGRLHSLK